MVDTVDHRQRLQGLFYGLLTPLALMALAVWLLEGPALRGLATVFAAYSAALIFIMPVESGTGGRSWFAGLIAALAAGATAWYGGLLTGVVMVLLVLSILRLWYLRQYHLKKGRQDLVELFRRCLLISLWSHISVLAALLNPY